MNITERAVTIAELSSADLARASADAIDGKQGREVAILWVGDLLRVADVFVIATGSSKRQIRTMAEEVEERLKGHHREPVRIEGREEGDWLLMDYGDLVVHLFSQQAREFYALERLWGDAPRVEWVPPPAPAGNLADLEDGLRNVKSPL